MVEGDDYATAICSFDIVLCFLRHSMRDVVTTRSFEIPACGAFMLAERSTAHLTLFREDEEAVFFESADEMIDKVRYYLAHPEERERIAAAGRARCLHSGYGNTERVASMLETISRHRASENEPDAECPTPRPSNGDAPWPGAARSSAAGLG